jgi:glucose-6-phosphate dehydrogenase assembly protein OpcA
MEDAVSELLPGAAEVAFVDLPATAEAAIATVVIVAPRDRMREAAEALTPSTDSGGVRPILIVSDSDTAQSVRAASRGILIEGLKPEHFDNAVAALRLSSLPTLVWWRGGSPDVLPGLAALADRLVLDAVDPRAAWPLVGQLAEQTAVTDVRWARLTRWRTLMAHFFDIPEVREASESFHSLEVRGGDLHAARLFAGWLTSSLRARDGLALDVHEVAGAPAIQHVRLGNGGIRLTLRLAGSRTCVVTSVDSDRGGQASRIVSLGDQGLAAVIAEELRVRAHDLAFERSVRAMGENR